MEEHNYRMWMQRQIQEDKNEVNWSELENEIAYRNRIRYQTESNSKVPIDWEDEQERLLRQKYVEQR